MKEVLSVCRHRCQWWLYPWCCRWWWWWRRWWRWQWYKAQLTITCSTLSLADGNHQNMKILWRKLSALNWKAWTFYQDPLDSNSVAGVPFHFHQFTCTGLKAASNPTSSIISNYLMLGFYVTDSMIVASLINWIFPCNRVFAKRSNQGRLSMVDQSPITNHHNLCRALVEELEQLALPWGFSRVGRIQRCWVEPQLLQLPAFCLYKPAWIAEAESAARRANHSLRWNTTRQKCSFQKRTNRDVFRRGQIQMTQ